MNKTISSFLLTIIPFVFSVETNAQSAVEANLKSIKSFVVLPVNSDETNC